MREEDTIPVWSGCFSPFKLVMFDDEDWSPSLDEINSSTYDNAKLFRLTLNVDVGISPLSLIVLFDGTLVLPAYADIPKHRALQIFNKHLTCLLLGGMIVEEVEPNDVSRGSLNLWGYHRHHLPVGQYTKLSQSLRIAQSSVDEAILLYRPNKITKKKYLKTHEIGLNLLNLFPNNLSTVLLPACTSYINEKWERALILGWTSIELMIEKLWTEKIINASLIPGIAPKRRKNFLSDTRTWSSSTRIELLWQIGKIPDTTYALADKARSARNSFVHSADECSPDAARSAIEATLTLISSIAEEAGLAFDASKLMTSLDHATPYFRPPIADEKGRLLFEPSFWRYPDPAPGFQDWGDRPFDKIPEIQLKPIKPKK